MGARTAESAEPARFLISGDADKAVIAVRHVAQAAEPGVSQVANLRKPRHWYDVARSL